MTEPGDTAEFVRLFSLHQREIYAFVLTLMPSQADADDIMQETGVVLWQKFGSFRPGTSFVRWGNQVAYYEILNFRKRRAREKLRFDDEVVRKLVDQRTAMSDQLDSLHAALKCCLERLPSRDRDLVQRRYQRGVTIRQVAEEVGRPVGAVYKSMQRILNTLAACVRREIRNEARG